MPIRYPGIRRWRQIESSRVSGNRGHASQCGANSFISGFGAKGDTFRRDDIDILEAINPRDARRLRVLEIELLHRGLGVHPTAREHKIDLLALTRPRPIPIAHCFEAVTRVGLRER